MTHETPCVPELFCYSSSSPYFSSSLASLRYTEQAPTSGHLHLLLPLLAHAPPHHSIPPTIPHPTPPHTWLPLLKPFVYWRGVLLSHVCLSVTLWTVVHQAPLSIGFSRQDYCSWLPFPPPEDRPNPEIEPASPALAGSFLTTERPGKSIKSTKMSIHYEHCVYSPLLLPPSLTPDTFYFLFHDTWCYLTRALFTCLLPLSPHDDGTLLCSLLYPQHLAQCVACG